MTSILRAPAMHSGLTLCGKQTMSYSTQVRCLQRELGAGFVAALHLVTGGMYALLRLQVFTTIGETCSSSTVSFRPLETMRADDLYITECTQGRASICQPAVVHICRVSLQIVIW